MNGPVENYFIENPVLMRQQIYDQIKGALLAGQIPPGSRLVEGRLAKQIKVSRTPVREALHLLEMEGLIESFPRVGYRVRKISWKEAEEICELRAVIEPLAAHKAIESGETAYVEALEQNLLRAEAELRKGDLGAFVQRDAEFDEIVVNASTMDTLIDIWSTLRRRYMLYRIEGHYLVSTGNETVAAHRRIFEYLKAGDREGVTKAIQDHLNQVKRNIRRYAFEEKKRSL